MTYDEIDAIVCIMKPKDFLPNWDALTPQEQERLKETHPAYFRQEEKRSIKSTEAETDIDFDGSSMVSEEELRREYSVDDEDKLSKNNETLATETR